MDKKRPAPPRCEACKELATIPKGWAFVNEAPFCWVWDCQCGEWVTVFDKHHPIIKKDLLSIRALRK